MFTNVLGEHLTAEKFPALFRNIVEFLCFSFLSYLDRTMPLNQQCANISSCIAQTDLSVDYSNCSLYEWKLWESRFYWEMQNLKQIKKGLSASMLLEHCREFNSWPSQISDHQANKQRHTQSKIYGTYFTCLCPNMRPAVEMHQSPLKA